MLYLICPFAFQPSNLLHMVGINIEYSYRKNRIFHCNEECVYIGYIYRYIIIIIISCRICVDDGNNDVNTIIIIIIIL